MKQTFLISVLFVFACSQSVPMKKVTGKWHRVKQSDTIERVASRYGGDKTEIAELNDLANDDSLKGRSEIFIPWVGKKHPGTGSVLQVAKDNIPPAKDEVKTAKRKNCKSTEHICMLFPVDGKISSYFGKRNGSYHEGIDIQASPGNEIKAALKGEVLYSGDGVKGYGNMVILKHAGDIVTVYAHNKKNLVSEGESVDKGQVIANVGMTGNTKGPHVHFEVRVMEKPVDPVEYLP